MKPTYLIVFLLVLGSFFVKQECLAQPIRLGIAQQGLLDLRRTDNFQMPVSLGGEWGFFWKQLLSATDKEPHPEHFVQFPSLWKDDSLNGHRLPSQGCASYTLTILLPSKRPRLGMEIPDVYCSYQFYVNGILQIENGKPGYSASSSIPFWATRTIALPAGCPDTLHLLMKIANYWHAKGGPYKELLIGDKDLLFLKKNREAACDLVLAGCLFMGGLFFLGLYLFGRQDKTTLYFSLFCILYSYRMIGTDAYVLHTLFLNLNWFVSIRLEYLSLSVGIAFFGAYTKNLYREDTHRLVINSMIGFCLLFSGLILVSPPLIFTQFLNFFLGAMFLCIAYAFYVYLQAARRRRSGSLYALLSTAVMLLIFLLINLHYFAIIPSLKGLLFAAYIAFFFLQSLALSHRFAHNFHRATLLAQQGLKAKSEFLSTMSHEIRTPLNAVIGMTHLLLRNGPRKDQEKDLDVLLFSASNLLSIVNNILDYTKIEEGKIIFERIRMDLGTMAANIVAGFRASAQEKGIDLQLILDEPFHGRVMGDPTRTTQVITNLVHNAIKFTNKGWVHMTLQVLRSDDQTAEVKVSVEDTGIGIARDKQQLIFERFTQADSSTSRSYGGTGLGLAISQKILELQGTRLELKSEAGRGSVFYFTQSFHLGTEVMFAQSAFLLHGAKKEQQLLGISILLVEDNPLNILVAQTILENEGAQIDVATNGQEALDIYQAGKHVLILMDLHMPVMDGFRATQLLRRQGETLPIIALTASTVQEVEGEAYAAGLTDIVLKPFNPDNLYRVILQYV